MFEVAVAAVQSAAQASVIHGTSDGRQRGGKLSLANIEIGDGAGLEVHRTILSGVKRGAGSVINASVLVAKDVPAKVFFAGNRTVSSVNGADGCRANLRRSSKAHD